MKVLGIETSCDETAAAVVEDGPKIVTNIIHSQVKTHAKFGGVVPEIASREHIHKIVEVVEKAVEPVGGMDGIDGVAVTSTTNKVSNAISGVTLNLAKVTTAADNFSLSIANDTSGLSTAANSFVTAYNNLAKAVTNLTKQTPSTTKGQASTGSPLAAESSVLNMMTQIRGTMLGALGDDGGMNLSQVGISFQKDGTLALDATKLTTAGNKDFDAVAKLFTGTSGVVPKLQKLMDSILGDSGTLATKTKGLQDSLKTVTDQQTAANDRLQTLKDNYTNQFNRLNVTLATMQSRQSYLTQQLAKLSKSS